MTARRALFFSYVDRYATLLVHTITSLVIARLLTPEQFGVFSLTAVLVAFIGPMRDIGASAYLMNVRQLTTQGIRAVWALQLLLGAGIGALLFALRGPVSAFYAQPAMAEILVVLAVNSLLIPFGALTSAWLSRELRFDRLAILRFAGALTGAIVSITLAWRDWGPISLAWGSLCGSAASAAVAAAYRPRHFPWLPSLKGVREVLGFGSSVSLGNMAQLISGGAAELLAGRMLGVTSSGFLARATGFVSLFSRLVTDSIFAVAQPMFARLHREGGDVAGAYLRSVALITGIGWPMLLCMAVLAEPMIRLLYGSQWGEAVVIAQILCLGGAFTITAALVPTVCIATGHHWLSLRLKLVSSALQIAFAAVGASVGLHALAWCLLGASVVNTCIWLIVGSRRLRLSLRTLLTHMGRSAALSTSAVAVPLLLMISVPVETKGVGWLIVVLSMTAIAAGLALLVCAALMRHPLWDEAKGAAARIPFLRQLSR